MPTYDGIGSSVTHEIEVVGDVFISNVEGGSLSTQVPFEIFSNVSGMATPPTDSRQVRLRVQPSAVASPDDSYVTDMGIQNTTDNYFFITAPQNTSTVGVQNTFVISKTSNVGIGTTDPQYPLHVVGNTWITGTLTASNIVGASPVTISSDLVVGGPVDITGTLSSAGITSSADVNVTGTITTSKIIANAGDNLLISSSLEVGTSNLFVNTTNGNVGIGVNAPTRKLQVYGDGQTQYGGVIHTTLVDPGSQPYESNAFSMSMGGYSHSIRMSLNTLILNAYGNVGRYGAIKFVVGDGIGTGNGQMDAITIPYGGNVGIGNASPKTNLHVNHDVHIEASSSAWNTTAGKGIYMRYSTNGGQDSAYIQTIDRSANTFYPMQFEASKIILNQGNVGIGTNNPSNKLTIKTNWATNDYDGIFIKDNNDNTYAIIAAQSTDVGGAKSAGYLRLYNTTGVSADGILFQGAGNSYINGGNVGIGITVPDATLHVIGPQTSTGYKLRLGDGTTSLDFTIGQKAGTNGYVSGWSTIDPNGAPGSGVAIWDALHVQGTLQVTSNKNFIIDHPVHPTTKKLIHTAVESPRVDLIYRGSIQLENGTAIVNIDRDCTGEKTCAMEDGTFEALCRDPVYYLQNATDFSRVIGTINNNLLTIISEDTNSTSVINWMVVAERKDRDILESKQTDDNGRLVTEILDDTERINRDGSKRY